MTERRVDDPKGGRVEEIVSAVETTSGKQRRILWTGIAVVLAACVLGAYFLDRIQTVADNNRQAIRVSCLLLSEQLIQSGGAPAPKGYQFSDVSKASRRLQERFIKIIVRSATPADLRYIAKQTAVIDKAGGPLVAPDCEDVAMHPERVERQLKASQAR